MSVGSAPSGPGQVVPMPLAGGTQARAGKRLRHHVVTLLVENKAGVLVRVAGLFARRGFNIFSLAVAPTHDPRFSRISIVVDVESAPLQQVVDQLDKLVNVVRITELHPLNAREAELLLVTVAADAVGRAQVIQLAEVFGAKVVDVGAQALTLRLASAPEAVDDFEEVLRPYGILELQRTGRIALPKLGPEA
ncbi:MAG: acetolactate synthase, small subunit [Acidimicrobiaceae bacterium]|jgi:acetolactate synthase-1/3 small subunit|nr:acetolactate synthase, small subunit [Acidimicrobiaceae bacterium]